MSDEKINYNALKLKCGLEIHTQLDTKHKLFCNCPTTMGEREPVMTIKRKLHPVASELGEMDVAAQFEYLRNRSFNYQVFGNETCLVELDEEPPRETNRDALRIVVQIALMMNCEIPNEIHVMRKTVIDGSNTSGFQRTMIVGLNGFARYKGQKIEITHVALEEDAAGIVEEKDNVVTYRLNRLGVPLVEIGTGLLVGYSPQEIQEIAYLIGMTCRSTNATKKGIGSIRQDVNVSIRGGERVEVKGVQELGLLAKVIENEVKRQMTVRRVGKEVRAALPDGTTKFTRPLPGAARMYPETDLHTFVVSKEMIEEIKKNLPEDWHDRLNKFKKMGLSDDLANQILDSEYADLFEKIVKEKRVEASVVANTFTSILKDLRREKIPVENLTHAHFEKLFALLKNEKIVKEGIQPILKALTQSPMENIEDIIKKLELEAISVTELKKIIGELEEKNPEASKDKLIGLVMARVRGKVDAQVVMKLIKK